jgi:hypothetical protein
MTPERWRNVDDRTRPTELRHREINKQQGALLEQ